MNEHDKKLEMAKNKFYLWEHYKGITHLNDNDRALWCDGFIEGMNLVEGKTEYTENAVNTPKKILGHKELNKEFLDFLNVYYGTNFTLDDIWAVESLDDSEFAYGKKWANKIELALIFFKQGYYLNKKWS